MLVVHLFSLLGTAATTLPSRIGSNWGGVVFSLILFGFAEFLLWRRGEMTRAAIMHNTLYGMGAVVIAWIGLAMVSVVLTVYDDHKNLAGAAVRIRHTGDVRQAKMMERFRSTEVSMNDQLQSLRTSYARLEGASDTLQNQNRGQQSTINNCQTQALKLLTPPIPGVKVFPVFHEHDSQMPSAEYILTTNIVRSPVDIVATCDFTIGRAVLHVLTESGATTELGALHNQISSTRAELVLSSPSWDIGSPAIVTVFFSGAVDRNPVCTMSVR